MGVNEIGRKQYQYLFCNPLDDVKAIQVQTKNLVLFCFVLESNYFWICYPYSIAT